MGKWYYFLLAILFLSMLSLSYGQSEITIDNPSISLRGNQIFISYGIGNNSSEIYSVRVEVTDNGGNLLNAKAFSGDIGKGVRGGQNKTIVWNLASDKFFIDEDLYFQLYAIATNSQNPSVVKARKVSKAGLILQSAAFPGLGLSRLHGGPHWIKGIAGYGCIAGSFVLNNMAYNTSLELESSSSPVEIVALRDQAIQQENISKILVYAAIGIWVTDLVWTVVAVSNSNLAFLDQNGMSVGSGFDTLSKTPLLALRYNF